MDLSPAKHALLEKWLKGQETEGFAIEITRRPENIPISLSLPQQRQLFLELLDRGTAVNNLSVFIELQGKLDLEALIKSANQILARHDALRMCFTFSPGIPTPIVLDHLKLTIPIVDLQEHASSQREKEAHRMAEREVLQPFDLFQAPLIRLKLYKSTAEQQFLLVIVHHTIADGWSLGVFLTELMQFYQANTLGQAHQLPDLPIQYTDYAYWQTPKSRQPKLETSMQYWNKQLEGELPILALPTNRPRGARQTFAGGTHRFVFPQNLMQSIEAFSQQEDATLFMAMLTGFYILLHRFCSQDEILIGTPVANRNLPEIQHLIGVFINTLVLRTNLSGDPGFRALLRRVRKVSLEAYAHQDLPFEKLVEELKPKRDLSRTPLFQVVFNLQNTPMPDLKMRGLKSIFRDIDRGVSQFDLTLMITRSGKEYQAAVEYNRDLFQPDFIARMFQSYIMLLEDGLARPECPISALTMVSQEELQELVYTLNQTHLDFPQEKCLHQLFEAQAEKTPEAIALIHQQDHLTYDAMNRRANAIAKKLQQLGVGPEVRVAIMMKKSLELLPALLGVHKIGGTYVPIHPAFPEERIQFILKDAEVMVLLTNFDPGLTTQEQVNIIQLNADLFSTDGHHPNPQVLVTADQLAYIMYTSGSTGTPKGVMVTHSSLVNFLWSMREKSGINQDDILLAVTSISFDIAALELFLPIITGAKVVIAREEVTTNPALLAEAITRHRITMMQATPATWQILLEAGWPGQPGLKALCGGDTLTRNLADPLLDRVSVLWNLYGPTETTIWSSFKHIAKGNDPITIGQPIANTQLYILDEELQPVPRGVIGELVIGGAGLARGYLNQPILTGDKFIPDFISAQPGARLYKTGDMARYLEDYSIEILGRTDDQVKINGHRIELGEITTILMQHPAVADAIVLAPRKANGSKQLIAYFVSIDSPEPEAAELRDFLRDKLPSHMSPAFFIPLDAFPLTANGKVDRKALPLPEDGRQLSGYAPPRCETENILVKIWQNVLDVEQIGIYDNFFDLGGASIHSIQVVAKANMYGYPITVENIFEYQSIAELSDFLQAHQ